MSFIASIMKKIFGGVQAEAKGTTNDNARQRETEAKGMDTPDETETAYNANQSKQENQRKQVSVDVWDEIDNLRSTFWLGGLMSRRRGTRPKEQLDEEMKELKEKLEGKGKGEEDGED